MDRKLKKVFESIDGSPHRQPQDSPGSFHFAGIGVGGPAASHPMPRNSGGGGVVANHGQIENGVIGKVTWIPEHHKFVPSPLHETFRGGEGAPVVARMELSKKLGTTPGFEPSVSSKPQEDVSPSLAKIFIGTPPQYLQAGYVDNERLTAAMELGKTKDDDGPIAQRPNVPKTRPPFMKATTPIKNKDLHPVPKGGGQHW
jgi:hypothetical protein